MGGDDAVTRLHLPVASRDSRALFGDIERVR
jgi:hypothetical protein